MKTQNSLSRVSPSLSNDYSGNGDAHSTRHEPTDGQYIPDLPIEQIAAWPNNPRKHFDQTALQELADSIKAHGLLQAIVVRPRTPVDNETAYFTIVMGERRWRAALLAGLKTMRVEVRLGIDDHAALRLAVTENVERESMTPMEEARAFQQMRDEGDKRTQIATTIGKSDAYVDNRTRLLKLPPDVQEMITTGQLSPAQALPLIKYAAFPEYVTAAAGFIVENKLPSHEVEKGVENHWQFQDELVKTGIIAAVRWDTQFDWKSVCPVCPFDAFVKFPNGGICMRPAHYEELTHAARKEKDAEASRARERARQALGGGSQKPGGSQQPDSGKSLKLSDLEYGTYERIYDSSNPAGCTEACPCRAKALERNGVHFADVCLDPSRLRGLKTKETKEKKAAQKILFDQYRAQLRKLAREWAADLEKRTLAVLAWNAFSNIPAAILRDLSTRTKDGDLALLLAKSRYDTKGQDAWSILAKVDTSDLLALLAEGLMQTELKEVYENNYSKPDKTQYLIFDRDPEMESKITQL